jgi:hypothetical protein
LLRSNEIDVNILPSPEDARQQELGSYLMRRSAARLLFYRDGELDDRGIEYLNKISSDFPREPSAAAAHYALGRMLIRKLETASREEIEPGRIVEAAHQHLSIASDHKHLSRHRRRKAEELLSDLSRPRRSSSGTEARLSRLSFS